MKTYIIDKVKYWCLSLKNGGKTKDIDPPYFFLYHTRSDGQCNKGRKKKERHTKFKARTKTIL
jgi:hypothetical protein